MDYEKMYNEALGRAKKFEEKYGGGYAEYIFPELTESEDERIRKELKEAFEAYDIESKWNGIPIRSIIAWLEKQKESLHIPETCKENADSFTDIKDRNIRGCIGMALADISESRFKMYGVTLKECLAWLERQKEPENTSASTMAPSCWEVEQKEQKPKAKAKSPLSPHELYDAKIEGISQGRQDVLDHPEQFGLQKPAEWSEEALNVMNLVYRCIRKVLAEFAVYTENEELLESREETVCYYSQRCAEKILKSLRPSRKPSKEQQSGSSALKAEGTNE